MFNGVGAAFLFRATEESNEGKNFQNPWYAFVEKLAMSKKDNGSKESTIYDENRDHLEEKQEKETGELNEETTTNQVF